MNKSRSLRLALIVTAVMIFAVALMGVFVLGDPVETANAASYDLGNGYSLTSLTINGISVDPSSWYSDYWTKNGNSSSIPMAYSIYLFSYDDIVAEIEKDSNPADVVPLCYDLGPEGNTHAPSQTPMDLEEEGIDEGNIYLKAWMAYENNTLFPVMVVTFKVFRVVLKGDFGGYYMEGENDYYASGESIYDRVKPYQESLESVNYSGMKWAEGMYNVYSETSDWSSNWSSFHNEATAGKVYTFYVPINNGYVSDGFMQFEVSKPRIYVTSQYTYDNTPHVPTLASLQIYKYTSKRNNCLLGGNNSNVVNYTPGAAETTAGTYPLSCTLKGSYATDYVLADASFVINKKVLTVVWSNNTFAYDGTEKTVTASYDGIIDGDGATYAFYYYNNTEFKNTATSVGNYTAKIWYRTNCNNIFNTNYQTTGSEPFDWSITPAPLTLSWSNDPVYNGSAQSVTATITGGVIGSDVVNIASYSGNSATNAGEYTATVTLGGANAANYTAASHDWEIVKGNIHISLNDKYITYGDAAPEYTATITGIASGEDESVLSSYTITCSYNTAQVANRGAGTYDISIPQTVTADNYDVFVTNGTLRVSKKYISITPNNIWITYGDAAPTTFSASITGFVYDEDESLLQGTLTYNLSGYDQSDKTKRTPTGYLSNFVDPQPVYPITCSGLTCTSSNYTVGHLTGYLGVRKKQLNFNWASPLTFIYDGTEKTVLAEPILAYADDDVYVSTYEGNTATHYTNQGDGKYTATITAVDGDDKGNYFFDHNSQNTSTKWKIEGRTLQVAVTIGDTTVTYSDWDWGNYSTEVIFPASFAYDTQRHEPTLAYVNLVEQDISGASFEVWGDIVGGAYRPRGSGSCIDAGNYWITYNLNVDHGDYLSTPAIKVCYKIDPAPLTLAWSGDNGATYDGTQKSVSATITGGVYSGDVVNIIGYTNNQKTAVGNYGAEALLYNSNNTSASPYGCNYYADPYLWSITPKGLTVTAEDKETTYGSGAPTFTVSYSGFATGDDESIFAGQTPSFACSYNTAQAANRGARAYAITPSGLTADNYDITFAPGTLTVGKKTVTVTANPKTITYGDAPAFDGVSYAGFEYGETTAVLTGTDTITCSSFYQQYAPAGDYAITPSGTVTADNYAISYAAGMLTVERRTLTFNWTIGNTTMTNAEWLAYVQNSSETYPLFPEAFVYNTAEQLPTVTFTNLVNGDQVAVGVVEKFRLFGNDPIAVLTCVGANNYMYGLDTIYPEINYALPSDGSENIYFTIAKAPLTLTGESVTITYGDAAPQTFDSQWAGFVGTENTDVLTGLNTVTCTCVYEQYGDAGSYDVTPSGTVTADNYAIEYVAGTLTVEQFEVSITWSGMDGFTTVYNGAEQTVVTGATVSNKLNNDDVSLTVTGGKGTNVSNETHLATAALAGAKAGNYKLPAAHTRSFTITPKPVSVSAIADDMTYSGEEKGVTASYTNALGQDVNIASAQITYTSGVSRVNYTGSAFYAYAEVIDDNYTLTGGGNTLENGKAKFGPYTITKRGVKATINSGLNAETLVYTGYAKQVSTGSVKFGPVSGDARNLVITGINGNNTEVTAAGFTVSFRLSDDDQVNYVLIEEASGSNAYTVTDGVGTTVNPWIITPATLTVTVVQQNVLDPMIYSGVAQTPYINTQVSSVHWQTITYLYSKTEGSGYVALDQITYKDVADVGTLYYKFTAPNHNDATGSIQITMAPKELTPTITGFEAQYTYGDAFNVSFSGVEGGLVGEDTLVSQGIAQTYEYSSYVNKAWSDWASLTISGMTEIRNSGQHKIRYNFTCESGNYVSHGATVGETLIVHRALTITPVDGQSKTYGEEDPVFTYTVSGSQYDDNIVPGDTFFTGRLARAYGFDAGTYAFERGTLVVNAPYSANYYMGEIPEGKVFTINKATLTVTADNKTVTYGTAAPTYTATITGFVGGETEAALRQNNKLSGGASVTCAYQAGNNVGTYTITAAENDLEATNYDFVYETGTLTVNSANLTVTSVLQDGVLTYSTAAQTPEVIATVTAVNDQAITYSYSKTEGSGYVALDEITYTDVADAGTLYYKFTAPNHNDATGEITITMNRAILTITAEDKSTTYGEDAPAFSATCEGFVGGQDENDLDGSLSFACEYDAGDPATTYDIVPSGYTSGNYQINYVNGTLTVSNVALTVENIQQTGTLTYNGTAQSPAISATVTVVNGQPVTYLYSKTENGDYVALDAITYKDVADVGTLYYKVTAPNHNEATGSLTITMSKAALTVTAKPKTITYGDVPANDGVAYSGFEGMDDESVLEGTVEYAYSYEQYGAVGAYTITPSGLTASNYTIEFAAGVLTVQNADFDIIVSPRQNGTLTYNGIVQRTSVSYTISSVNDQYITKMYCKTENGTYVTLNELDYLNVADAGMLYYKFTAPNHNEYAGSFLVTMNKATLTITAKPKSITYGAAPANNGVMYSGWKGNDDTLSLTGTLSYSYTYEQYGAVGTYAITPSGLTSDNYQINYVNGTLTVGNATLTVEAVQQTGTLTYTGTAQSPAVSATVTTVNNQTVTYLYSKTEGSGYVALDQITYTDVADAGTLYYKFTAPNHNDATGSLTITMGKATLTVKAKDVEKFYGRDAHNNFGVSYSGFVNGENESVLGGALDFDCEYNREDPDHRASGTYDIVPKGLTSDNYNITFVKGTLTIKPRLVTVTANPKTITYGEAPANDGVTYSDDFVFGETSDVFTSQVGYEYTYAQYGAVGTYAITPSGATADNYIFVYVDGTLTVEKATLTVTPTSGQRKDNGAADPELTYDVTGAVNNETPVFGGALSREEGEEPGSYDILIGTLALTDDDVNANYEISFVSGVKFAVGKAALTLTVSVTGWTYGDNANAPVTSGNTSGGAETIEYKLTSAEDTAYTTEVPSAAGDYTVRYSVAEHENYFAASVTNTFVISRKALEVVWDTTATWVYDGTATQSIQIASAETGVPAEEVVINVTADRTFKDAGDYTLTATLTDAAVNANYTLTNATYDVSIAAKEIAVVWTLPQGGYVYNGADQIASLQGVATANTGIENETVTLTVVADKTFKDADDYVLTAEQTNPNYTLTNEETQATIAPKTITIDFNSTGKTATYGDEDEWDALGDEMQDNAMYLVTEDETALADLGGAPLVIIASYRFDTQADGSGTSVSMADVGPELAAGTYYLIVTSTDDNYVFEVAEGFVEKAILVVTKATLTITAENKTVTYGDAAPDFTVSYDGFVNGEGVGSLGGTLGFSCGYTVGAAAGSTYDITPSDVSNGNYDITFVSGTLTVEKKTLTVTYKHDEPLAAVYGDASVYSLNPYEHVNLDGIAAVDMAAIATNPASIQSIIPITVAVGSNKATATPLLSINGSNFGYAATYWLYVYAAGASANYTVVDNLDDNAKLVISKKALTLTANDATVPYGNEAPEFTVGTDDFAYDDATKAFNVVFSGTLTFSCDYNAGDAVGNTYDVMPGSVTAGNYEVSFAPGTLTVAKRELVLTYKHDAPISYVYGDASVYQLNPYEHVNIGGDGFASSDLTLIAANGEYIKTLVPITVAVGSNKATAQPLLQINGSNFGYVQTYWLYLYTPGVGANYTVTNNLDDNAKLVINKAPLTVTAENKSVKYGEEAPEFTVGYDGFAYDDATKAFNLVFGGELDFDCDYQPGTSVGTVGITPKDITAGNYEINFVPGALTVTPREITVSNTNDASFSYVYGDNAVYGLATTMGSIVTVSGDGFADGDDFASVGVLTLAVGANKATASPITSALSATNFGYAATYWLCVIPTNDNYVITDGFDEKAKVVISKKALTITADDKTVAYGDTAPSFTVTYDGFVGGNYNDGPAKLTGTLEFTCAYDITDATNRAVGEYTVIPYGVTNGNYDITFVPGTLTVETRLVTLTWGSTNLVYNKTEQVPSVTVGNVVYGETVAVEVTGAASTVGTYTATAAISDENYRLPIDNTKAFAIAKKAITVTAEDKESNLNYDLVQLTAVAQGILEGDEVFTLSTTADKNVAGEYPIVVTLTGNDNYDVTAVNGTYTVKSNVTVIDDKDGTKVVEGKETVDKDAAKEGEGVSIKNMIKNVIDAAAEAPVANLSIEIGNGATITFNKAALVELAKADDVRIIYSETLGVDVDRSNKDLKNAELVINVSLGDVTFDGGLATVTTSFNNDAPLGKRAVVYYVDENGKKTDMKATFKDGTVTFTTGHFSTYTVEYVWKTGALVANIVASIVAFALIVLLIFFIIKKIKNKKNKPDPYEAAREQAEQEAEEASAEEEIAEEEVVYEDENYEETEEEPREMSLSESLAGARDFGAVGIVTKASIIEHLAETFGDKVEVNARENRTPNGKLLLSDNHFAFAPNGKRVCFTYVYQDDDGDVIILLRTTAEHAHEIRQAHKSTGVKSAFPKNKERDWYSVIVDNTFTESDVYELLDRAALNIIGQTEPIEEEEMEEVSLSESLAGARDFGAVGIVTKASIIEHLVSTFGDKVEVNARENRTPNGKLLLSDNHFAFAPNGKKVCFTYVYEDDEGDIIILLRTTASHARDIHTEHAGTCVRSAFPKNKEKDWYSIIVDNTFSDEDVYDLLDRAVLNIIGE